MFNSEKRVENKEQTFWSRGEPQYIPYHWENWAKAENQMKKTIY